MKIESVTPQIAALYLGQKCDIEWLRPDYDLIIYTGEVWTDLTIETIRVDWVSSGDAKIIPHLRRLSSMTEVEAREVFEIRHLEKFEKYYADVLDDATALEYFWKSEIEVYNEEGLSLIGHPPTWLYLISKGFDILGLIDAGLAKEVQ